jgi:shikimate dehydrogenase
VTRISGKTQLYGVIGNPVEHSLSPAIQNAAFEKLRLDGVFLAFEVAPEEVENALRGMHGLGICGLNVTMPYKSTVIPYLDEIDSTAELLASVNTIANEAGKLRGFSTDGIGALKALEENGLTLSGKKIVLLGSGGAAKAIAFALAEKVEKLILLNRNSEKSGELVKLLKKKFKKEISSNLLTEENMQESILEADILVNATSVGMFPNTELSLVKSDLLKSSMTVLDIVYNPLETKLSKEAKQVGAKVISGLEMLLYQGAASFEIWTGQKAPVEVMRKAALDHFAGE